MTPRADYPGMPIEPPTDVLTIRAWVECEKGKPVIRARLIYAPALRAQAIRRAEATEQGILLGVREWLERLEESGVTYCDTIE